MICIISFNFKHNGLRLIEVCFYIVGIAQLVERRTSVSSVTTFITYHDELDVYVDDVDWLFLYCCF